MKKIILMALAATLAACDAAPVVDHQPTEQATPRPERTDGPCGDGTYPNYPEVCR